MRRGLSTHQGAQIRSRLLGTRPEMELCAARGEYERIARQLLSQMEAKLCKTLNATAAADAIEADKSLSGREG